MVSDKFENMKSIYPEDAARPPRAFQTVKFAMDIFEGLEAKRICRNTLQEYLPSLRSCPPEHRARSFSRITCQGKLTREYLLDALRSWPLLSSLLPGMHG